MNSVFFGYVPSHEHLEDGLKVYGTFLRLATALDGAFFEKNPDLLRPYRLCWDTSYNYIGVNREHICLSCHVGLVLAGSVPDWTNIMPSQSSVQVVNLNRSIAISIYDQVSLTFNDLGSHHEYMNISDALPTLIKELEQIKVA